MDDFAHIVGEDVHFRGRSPSGERGLKYTRGTRHDRRLRRRSPSGERGLKYTERLRAADEGCGRSPSGERGLKLHDALAHQLLHGVAPHPGSVD